MQNPITEVSNQSRLSILSSVENLLSEATTDYETHDLQYYRGKVDALQSVLNLLREETPGVFSPGVEPDTIDMSDAVEPGDTMLSGIIRKLDRLTGALAMITITAAGAAA